MEQVTHQSKRDLINLYLLILYIYIYFFFTAYCVGFMYFIVVQSHPFFSKAGGD